MTAAAMLLGVAAAAKMENVPVEWGGDWKPFRDGPQRSTAVEAISRRNEREII